MGDAYPGNEMGGWKQISAQGGVDEPGVWEVGWLDGYIVGWLYCWVVAGSGNIRLKGR